MASRAYTRYVPPEKSKVLAAPEVSEKGPNNVPPEEPAPPSAQSQQTASAVYSRYVPPTPKTVSQLDSNNDKKRKREPEPQLERPKKAKKVKEAALGKEDDAPEDDSKYKKVMERRYKSLKKAEKIARKEAKKAAKAKAEGESEEAVPEEPIELHDLVPLPQPEPVPELPTQSASASLPLWLASPIRIAPTATADFPDLGIQKEAVRVLQSKGFDQAFAVQAAVLPLLLPGKSQSPGDIVVSAATGSGKTLSYVLPIIEDISQNLVTRLRALIIMPTRELVTQAREVCEVCAGAFSSGNRKRVKIGTAVGSEPLKVEQTVLMEQEDRYDPEARKEQERRLNRKWESSDWESDSDDDDLLCDEEPISKLPDHVIEHVPKIDILICTPGRLVEHIKSTPGFTLADVKWLVVDEADKLLDQTYQDFLDIVIRGMATSKAKFDQTIAPQHRVRKVILSATMTKDVGKLAELKLYRPKMVVLDSNTVSEDTPYSGELPATLIESAIKVDEEDKPLYLMGLLVQQNLLPDSATSNDIVQSLESPTHGVLIFTKSNASATLLARLISLLSPQFQSYFGTLTSTTSTSTRKTVISSFNTRKLSILIASDLVSRGLDLHNLECVVNYDVPTSVENYVHRVGRTARAGKEGKAITLYTEREAAWFWHGVASDKEVRRPSGEKVRRVRMGPFGEEERKIYEGALERLGREAKGQGEKRV